VEFDEVNELKEQEIDNELIVSGEGLEDGDANNNDDDKDVALWFSKDVFTDFQLSDGDDDEEDDDENLEELQQDKKKVRKKEKETENGGLDIKKKENQKEKKEEEQGEEDYGFEIVKLDPDAQEEGANQNKEEDDDEEESSNFEPESDLEERITTLAIAKQFLKSKKRKREIQDMAYNRYAFNDTFDAPLWFIEDEEKHNKPTIPITKEDVEEFRKREREINARPIKKVAEAKARKKRRLQRKLTRVQSKVNSISEQSEMSELEKTNAIQQLYKQATKSSKKEERICLCC